MNLVETTQTEQGQVSNPVIEPKDEEIPSTTGTERDNLAKETVKRLRGTGSTDKYLCKALDGVKHSLQGYNPLFRKQVLEAALEDVHQITDRASRLNAMRARVCKIYDRLDLKAKAAITALQELAAVEGCSVGVDYGNELLYVTGRDQGCIEQARADMPDDQDVACLAEVFELSSFINKAV